MRNLVDVPNIGNRKKVFNIGVIGILISLLLDYPDRIIFFMMLILVIVSAPDIL